MNLLNLRGPDFLAVYFTLSCSAALLALWLRWVLRDPGGDGTYIAPRLDRFEVAYLAGGANGVVDAAVAGLVHCGILSATDKRGRITVLQPLPTQVLPLEKGIFGQVQAAMPNGRKLADLRIGAAVIAQQLAPRLREYGLILGARQRVMSRLAPALVMLLVLLLGIAKICVGVSRNRPVGFLLMFCLFVAGGMGAFLILRPIRTRRGDAALGVLRRGNAALRTTAVSAIDSLAGDDLVLALALFGPAVLTGSPLQALRLMIQPPPQSGSYAGSSSGGCASAGCGGGGCGGGGCGGGGCGGCGG